MRWKASHPVELSERRATFALRSNSSTGIPKSSRTLLGHRAHTEELQLQSKATDIWAEYQAKSIRENTLKSFAQVLNVLTPGNKEAAKKLSEDFTSKAEAYSKEKEALKEEATELERDWLLAVWKNDFDLDLVVHG